MPLPWIAKDLLTDVDNWGFSETVTGAMKGLTDAGADLMRPVQEHVGQAVESARSMMPAVISQPEIRLPVGLPPELPKFDLGSVEDWLPGLRTAGAGAGAEAREAALSQTPASPSSGRSPGGAPTSGRSPGGMFSLPTVDDFLGVTRQPSSSQPAAVQPGGAPPGGAPPAPHGVAPRHATGGPGASDPWGARAYSAAVAAGHPNPTEFVEQMRWESGGFAPDVVTGKRASSAGAQGIAQIMPEVARSAGVNPLDPDAALAYAARRMAGNYRTYNGDSERALAEYNMGAGNLQKYGPRGLAETNKYIDIIGERSRAAAPAAPPVPADTGPVPTAGRPTGQPRWGTYSAESLTPNQVNEGVAQGLTMEEALAVCGPAAAVAFSRAAGRTPTLKEAKELAAQSGVWDASVGMRGPASEVALLEKMGVPARLSEGADWNAIRAEVAAGRPVIVDTPNHYFTVTDAYDDGSFEFGQSAGVLKKSGGRTRYRPEQIAGLGMGAPRASIFMR